jgi:hypothetical protein
MIGHCDGCGELQELYNTSRGMFCEPHAEEVWSEEELDEREEAEDKARKDYEEEISEELKDY